jgi:hypothetical protein
MVGQDSKKVVFDRISSSRRFQKVAKKGQKKGKKTQKKAPRGPLGGVYERYRKTVWLGPSVWDLTGAPETPSEHDRAVKAYLSHRGALGGSGENDHVDHVCLLRLNLA